VQSRGGRYDYNASSSWVPNLASASNQIYFLTLESNLGYDGKGRYGFDDITLGSQGEGGASLKNQTVAGIATKQYYMGLFGLAPRPTNFSSDGAAVPSFMENLRSQGEIPSVSWGYTAGNQYRELFGGIISMFLATNLSTAGLNQVLGSLTLGGYDASRFIRNDFSVPFTPDADKDLTVQIDSISTDKEVSLLSSPILAFLDSTVPYIYLPTSACTLFEDAFGLVWNDTAQLYLVNTTQHALLQAQNPNVTFTIGSNYTSSKVNITLPYAAFDLTASYPLVSSTSRYFPLRRANDSTQYTLGRTFFQEAYVIADFERKNFSVSQCKWVQAPQNIVAILPPADSVLGPTSQHKSLSKGGIAGIAVGVALIALGAVLLWFLWWKPRQRKRKAAELAAGSSTRRETQEYYKPELESSPATTAVFEAHDGRKIDQMAEIGTHNEIHELPAREEVAAEMTGITSPSEIGGREQRWSWVRGDSRASRFRFGSSSGGTKSPGSPGSTCEPGEGTMSSLSSGYGTLVDHIVSPQVVSPESPFQSLGDPSKR
jgi:hypothetical protein